MDECALPEQCEIHFLESGIRVLPYELTTETPYHWLSNAKAKVSREAGELIKTSHSEAEPVIIKINGTPQDRYVFSNDSINMKGEDAHLDLWDSLAVLKRGTIQKQFPYGELKEIINYVIDNKDDPSSVITGVAHPGEEISQKSTGDFLGKRRANIARGSGKLDDIADSVRTTLLDIAEASANFVGMDIQEGGIYIERESPWVAVKKTMKEFSFTPWVDTEGKFHYASPMAGTGNTVNVEVNTGSYRLNEYNFFEPAEQPASTLIRGTYQMDGLIDRPMKGVYLVGEAYYPGGAKCSIPQGEPRDLHSLEAVESAAARTLNEQWMQVNSGNFVINSANSASKSTLASMRPGDVTVVSGSFENCKDSDQVVEGAYMINGVTHELGGKEGWQTTIQVSLAPPAMETDSYIYDTRQGTRFDDMQSFKDTQIDNIPKA